MRRRTFLGVAAVLLQGAAGAAVALPGLRVLLAPFRRRARSSPLIRVAPLSAIQAQQPVRVSVSKDRWDAYTHYPPGPIGSVWLQLKEEGDGAAVRCLQSICPHLGCAIDYTAERHAYVCPCHASEFDLNGHRRTGPSPRDMDELVCHVTEADEAGRRWVEVQYEEFQIGRPNRKPVA